MKQNDFPKVSSNKKDKKSISFASKIRQFIVTTVALSSLFLSPLSTTSAKASTTSAPTKSSSVTIGYAVNTIDGNKLKINPQEFISHKHVKGSKLMDYSDAEEELMELEALDEEFRWMKTIQQCSAGTIVAVGLFALQRGGKAWDAFIKAQEEREIEEEMRLTGRFIDTRANRMDEEEQLKREAEKKRKEALRQEGIDVDDDSDENDDDEGTRGSGGKDKKPDDGSGNPKIPSSFDIDALEKLLKKDKE